MSDTTGSQSTPLLENSKRYLQLPVDRLKKEEDEDQWISGEELFTEGSSDEDDPALSTRRKKRDKSPKFMRKTHHRETGDGHQESKQEKSSKVKESATPKARNIPTILEPNQKNPADFSESSLSSNTGSHFFEPQETSSRSQEESNTEREEGEPQVPDALGRVENESDSREDAEAGYLPEHGLAENAFAERSSSPKPEISWRPKRGSIKLPDLNCDGRLELLSNTEM